MCIRDSATADTIIHNDLSGLFQRHHLQKLFHRSILRVGGSLVLRRRIVALGFDSHLSLLVGQRQFIRLLHGSRLSGSHHSIRGHHFLRLNRLHRQPLFHRLYRRGRHSRFRGHRCPLLRFMAVGREITHGGRSGLLKMWIRDR